MIWEEKLEREQRVKIWEEKLRENKEYYDSREKDEK